MKLVYTKVTQRQIKNPFYRLINQDYHDALVNLLSGTQDYIMENLSYWVFQGTDEQRDLAEWLLTIPDTNKYGEAKRGEKDGVYNSPASCLAGAIHKLRKGKPGSADLSKVQVTNLKKVLTKLNEFDSSKFKDIKWEEAKDDNYEQTPIQKIRNKLGGNTFNNMFEFAIDGQ